MRTQPTQQEINDAFLTLLHSRRLADFAPILDAIQRGDVELLPEKNQLRIKARKTGALGLLAAELGRLRRSSGFTVRELASATGVSHSAIMRALSGNVLMTWPSLHLIVTTMGGEPGAFRPLWDQAKQERAQRSDAGRTD